MGREREEIREYERAEKGRAFGAAFKGWDSTVYRIDKRYILMNA